MKHPMRILRVLDGRLIASDCMLEMDFFVDPEVDPVTIHLHLNAMKLWLDGFVDECVVHDIHVEQDMSWLAAFDNLGMQCPGEPRDHAVLALLHAKLSAIGADVIRIKRTVFGSDTGHGFSSSISGSPDDWLPSADEWLGRFRVHDAPWWNRGDATMGDLFPNSQQEAENAPDLGPLLIDMLNEGKHAEDTGSNAEIIKPRFGPRLLDEGE